MNSYVSVKSRRFFVFTLCLVIGMIASSSATAQGVNGQTADSEAASTVTSPDLADLIPMASELAGRLKALENNLTDLPEISTLEAKYSAIDSSLAYPAERFERLSAAEDFRYNRIMEIREEIRREKRKFEEASSQLSSVIRILGVQRDKWLTEKETWNKWQAAMKSDAELEQLESTFEKVHGTVETALALILSKLSPMLTLQMNAGSTHEKIIALTVEIDVILERRQSSALTESSPFMLSSEFIAQVKTGFWDIHRLGLDELSIPGREFLSRRGWLVTMQVLFSLLLIAAFYKKRTVLKGSERWRFLGERPLSAGLFFISIANMLIYEYGEAPEILKLVNDTVAAVTFVRLSSSLVDKSWKRMAIAGLMAVLIITKYLYFFGVAQPYFRIYTVLVSLIMFMLCLRWISVCRRSDESALYAYSLIVGSFIFAVVVVTEIWGVGKLPIFLLITFIETVATVVVFMLFLYIIRGGIERLFRGGTLRQTSLLKNIDTDSVIRRTSNFIDFVICGLVLVPGILVIWGVYQSLGEATEELLSLGFTLGSKHISVGLLITTTAILYGVFFISWIIQRSLMEGMFAKFRAERGVRYSIARLVHYVIVFIGFLIVISVLGFDITKFTILISALGVGIGFGLQGIVNNFVSGLILLFERPVRVGDYIEITGKWVEIKKIGIRSTLVHTFDDADVIIPNADLISNQVVNWTLSNRQIRLIVPLGVAYGSNVELVMERLLACAAAVPKIAKSPLPRVLFRKFGEISLEFELWIWIVDADYRMSINSEIHQEIDRAFKEAGIEIAFPQLDLHLRSVNDDAVLRIEEDTDQ